MFGAGDDNKMKLCVAVEQEIVGFIRIDLCLSGSRGSGLCDRMLLCCPPPTPLNTNSIGVRLFVEWTYCASTNMSIDTLQKCSNMSFFNIGNIGLQFLANGLSYEKRCTFHAFQ